MLPYPQLLNQVASFIKERGKLSYYCLFLLGKEAGLRVSEAVKFDLNARNRKGLYRIEKPKGKSKRLVYVPKEIIKELKANNWQPNQTNRFAFYHFLKKIKRELGIANSTELTPHTLRRAFATYQAESGMPLPLLQKLLGHSSIRTTALYWQNIYGEDDPRDILTGKKWLESHKPSQSHGKEPQPPTSENFALPKNTELEIPTYQPTIKPNSPPTTIKSPVVATKKEPQPLITKIPIQATEQTLANTITKAKAPMKNSEQPPIIVNEKEQPTKKEQFLLGKIRDLEEQLKQTTTECNNFKALVKSEKQRANYYQQQLKSIVKTLYQLQKINYYKQLEQEQNQTEAKIEQTPTSLPWKPKK